MIESEVETDGCVYGWRVNGVDYHRVLSGSRLFIVSVSALGLSFSRVKLTQTECGTVFVNSREYL